MAPENSLSQPNREEPTELDSLNDPQDESLLSPLSDRDRDLFIELLQNPPKPTQALLDAIRRYRVIIPS
jgi:hypothetical protein